MYQDNKTKKKTGDMKAIGFTRRPSKVYMEERRQKADDMGNTGYKIWLSKCINMTKDKRLVI